MSELKTDERPWEEDDLIVTVKYYHPCPNCQFRVLPGSQAVRSRDFGYYKFKHYPKCPRSAKENKGVRP